MCLILCGKKYKKYIKDIRLKAYWHWLLEQWRTNKKNYL
jgi:hypothetical protein